MWYLYLEKPCLDPLSQKIQEFNEFCFYFMALVQIGFTDHGTDINTKLTMGWFFVYINMLMIGPNVVIYAKRALPYIHCDKLGPKKKASAKKLEMSRQEFIRKFNKKLKGKWQMVEDNKNYIWTEKQQPKYN